MAGSNSRSADSLIALTSPNNSGAATAKIPIAANSTFTVTVTDNGVTHNYTATVNAAGTP